MYTVYKITNSIEHKSYIGFTSDFSRRKKDHMDPHAKFSSINHLFQKLPPETWFFEILAENIEDKYEAMNLEEKYITELNTLVPNGYNKVKRIGFNKDKANALWDSETYQEKQKSSWNKIRREKLIERNKYWHSKEEYYKNHVIKRQIYEDDIVALSRYIMRLYPQYSCLFLESVFKIKSYTLRKIKNGLVYPYVSESSKLLEYIINLGSTNMYFDWDLYENNKQRK